MYSKLYFLKILYKLNLIKSNFMALKIKVKKKYNLAV